MARMMNLATVGRSTAGNPLALRGSPKKEARVNPLASVSLNLKVLLNRTYWIVKTSVELPRRIVSANA